MIMMLFLLIGGLACIFVPSVILGATGMSSMEDEPAVCWIVRILGVVFVGIACWCLYRAWHN